MLITIELKTPIEIAKITIKAYGHSLFVTLTLINSRFEIITNTIRINNHPSGDVVLAKKIGVNNENENTLNRFNKFLSTTKFDKTDLETGR